MVTLTVRILDDDLVRRLCIRAAENGRSGEAERREILRIALFGEGRLDRRDGTARLADFRRRTAGRRLASATELLRGSRSERMETLAGKDKGP